MARPAGSPQESHAGPAVVAAPDPTHCLAAPCHVPQWGPPNTAQETGGEDVCRYLSWKLSEVPPTRQQTSKEPFSAVQGAVLPERHL